MIDLNHHQHLFLVILLDIPIEHSVNTLFILHDSI